MGLNCKYSIVLSMKYYNIWHPVRAKRKQIIIRHCFSFNILLLGSIKSNELQMIQVYSNVVFRLLSFTFSEVQKYQIEPKFFCRITNCRNGNSDTCCLKDVFTQKKKSGRPKISNLKTSSVKNDKSWDGGLWTIIIVENLKSESKKLSFSDSYKNNTYETQGQYLIIIKIKISYHKNMFIGRKTNHNFGLS